MPRFKTTNPQFDNIPQQDIAFNIPNEGEIFLIDGGPQYGMRLQGRIYEFGLLSGQGTNNPQDYAVGRFNPVIIGVGGNLQNYNRADLKTAFEPQSRISLFAPASPQMVQSAVLQANPDINQANDLTPVQRFPGQSALSFRTLGESSPTGANLATGGQIQGEQRFYQPDPADPTLYTASGQPIDYATYKSLGGKGILGGGGWTDVVAGQPPQQSQQNPLQNLRSQLNSQEQGVFDTFQKWLTQGGSQQAGVTINPNKPITPEAVSEFMNYAAQNQNLFRPYAEKEILPYFQSQLKLAKDSFLNHLGYSQDQILQQEKQDQQTYTKNLRTLGQNYAEQGFSLSGLRNQAESELSQATQNQIDTRRRELSFNSGNLAREFTQKYGSAGIETPQIAGAPRVLPGQEKFDTSGQPQGLYQLSPEIYKGLQGSQQYQQESDILKRSADLEKAFNQYNTAGARSLNY